MAMFSSIKAPEGFRSIPATQAIMEFGKPVMEKVTNQEEIETLNEALKITTLIWNYTLSLEKGVEDSKVKSKIIGELKTKLKLTEENSVNFLAEMIARKSELFPPKIQPPFPMIMFMRKEGQLIIKEFDYESINFSKEPIAANEKDLKLIESIKTLDRYISSEVDYGEWEDLYFLIEEQSSERFGQWLLDKGMSDWSDFFPFCVQPYLSFIYQYGHDSHVFLNNISIAYLREFFYDYLLRKVLVEPNQYIYWPPALKFFQRFLQEKGYFKKALQIIKKIDKIEPDFIEILRQRY